MRKDNELVMTGSFTVEDGIQFWDIRKPHEPVMTFDWCGGIKDAKGEWINKPKEYDEIAT